MSSGLKVIIDGSWKSERYAIVINGTDVWLTGKSFKYLCRLAWARKNKAQGWIYKTDIESGYLQARYIYRMRCEIYDQYNVSWSITENNRLGYYRLDIPADKLYINKGRLCQHPDYEVSSLFAQVAGGEV